MQLNRFDGIQFTVVEDGHTLHNPHTGKYHVVTEGQIVFQGLLRAYCVQADYDRIKARATKVIGGSDDAA